MVLPRSGGNCYILDALKVGDSLKCNKAIMMLVCCGIDDLAI